MFDGIKDYIAEKEDAAAKSTGFFSRKLIIRIIILLIAVVLLFVAKNVDAKQAEKKAALDAALQNAASINAADAGIDVGPAPDFALKNFKEKDDTLSAHFGRPIVLSFWTTWSDESKRTLPTLDDAYDKFGAEVDFMLVNLTDGKQDSVSIVKSFIKDAGYGFPVYFDTEHNGELAYNVLALPMTVFIDRDANVTACVLELMIPEELEAQINAIL